jgi:hypothetical protein
MDVMRFYVALAVAALGLGAYAVAALLLDRRAAVRRWLRQRRTPATAGAGHHSLDVSPRPVNPTAVPLTVAGLIVLGTMLIFGACVGLIRF